MQGQFQCSGLWQGAACVSGGHYHGGDKKSVA